MAKVCIIGFGCVGSGTYEILKENKDLISMRTGETVDVKYVVDIRDFTGHEIAPIVTTDFDAVLSDKEVDIVIETMGGTTFAYQYTKAALESKKSVVTSNKELVAAKGDELFAIARKNGVKYFYEAAVGGGIPIIRPLITSLGANKITEITGILNGTTNYILTNMLSGSVSFEKALFEAQKLGYAESNPSADVDGFDTGKKISILSSMVLGKKVNYEDVYTEGITAVTEEDTRYAAAMDCVIKLIGKYKSTETGDEVYVAPMLVKSDSPLYKVDDVFNGILVNGDMLGQALFYGKGAGKLATASAVVSDVMEVVKDAKDDVVPAWVPCNEKITKDFGEVCASFFVRIKSSDNMLSLAVSRFKDERIFEIIEGEFALVTPCMKVSEAEKLLEGIDVIKKYMFA